MPSSFRRGLAWYCALVVLTAISCVTQPVSSFVTSSEVTRRRTCRHNWLGELWDEVIEFSTYGPSERRILKARRMQQEQQEQQEKGGQNDRTSPSSFNPKRINDSIMTESKVDMNQAFRAAKQRREVSASKEQPQPGTTQSEDSATTTDTEADEPAAIDGYAVRDVLMQRWGVPLDVGFQRGQSGDSVYVTVLPVVGYGNRRQSRHDTELDYLQHLQAIVEILQKYDNLEPWMDYLQRTSKVPQPGRESIPFRLNLSPSDAKKILGKD